MALLTLPRGINGVEWTPPALAEYVSKSSFSGKATIINRGGVTAGFRASVSVAPRSNADVQDWKAFAMLAASKANLFRIPASATGVQTTAPVTVAAFGAGVTSNELLQVAALTNAAWGTVGLASVTANTGGPNGHNDASFLLLENTSTGVHYLAQGATLSVGSPYCLSVWAAPSARDRIMLDMPSAGISAKFNLSTGQVIGAITGIAAGMEQDDFGWWRCWVAGDAAVASTGAVISILDGSNAVSYTGLTGFGVRVTRPQLEYGLRPSPVVQNVASVLSSYNGIRLTGLATNSTILRRGAMVAGYDRLYTLTQDLQTGAAGTSTAIVAPQLGRLPVAGDVLFLRAPFARMRMTSGPGWADRLGYGEPSSFECEEAL
jgi:hypothetical protein